jgi:hypothetical protein
MTRSGYFAPHLDQPICNKVLPQSDTARQVFACPNPMLRHDDVKSNAPPMKITRVTEALAVLRQQPLL